MEAIDLLELLLRELLIEDTLYVSAASDCFSCAVIFYMATLRTLLSNFCLFLLTWFLSRSTAVIEGNWLRFLALNSVESLGA